MCNWSRPIATTAAAPSNAQLPRLDGVQAAAEKVGRAHGGGDSRFSQVSIPADNKTASFVYRQSTAMHCHASLCGVLED